MYSLLTKSIFIILLLCSAFGNLHAASDLVVTTLSSPPASLTPGTKFSLTSTVKNQGDAASPKTVTNYYLSGGSSKAGAWLLSSKHSVKGLAPLANTTKKVKITVPPGIPSNTYYLLACADDTNQAAEDKEDNNCTPSSITVDLTAPDLVIHELSGLPSTSAVKSTFSIDASVKNRGTIPSGLSKTYFYWSPDRTLYKAARAGIQSVPELTPQEVFTSPVPLKAPKKPGTYYFLACADGSRKVQEADEDNCITVSPVIIGAPSIAFSFTKDPGKANSLPPGATTVRVTFDGAPMNAKAASGLNLITFPAPDGEHTYTAQALSGTTTLASLGPITISTLSSFPLTMPLAFSFSSFDTYQTDIGLDTPNTLIYFGDDQRNRIVQYGGTADDLLSVDTGAADDWIEQYGGGGVDTIIAEAGTGNDFIYQAAGSGSSNLTAIAAIGDDWIMQKGGDGNDTLDCVGGDGNDYSYQEGGAGDDTIRVTPGYGNDTAIIDAGAGDDAITYNIRHGTDTASIDGGTGTDMLTVNNSLGLPVQIWDSNANVIYQFGVGGTTITVKNIEQITVNDAGGNPIFTWPQL